MRKHLKNHREVCHYWANQTQPFGQCGNIFFEGPTIYSYGHHFPMAVFTGETDANERSIVLMTTRRYSSTTAKHLSYTLQALHDVRVIHVPYVSPVDHIANMRHFQDEIDHLAEELTRVRSRVSWKCRDIGFLLSNSAVYARMFKLSTKPATAPANLRQIVEKAKEREKRKEAADAEIYRIRREAREERQRLEALELPKKIDAWRSGASVRLPYSIPVMLRLSKDGKSVETSLGALVPLVDAETVYRLWKRCGETGSGYLPAANNEFPLKVGVYTLNMIDTDGNIRIGCHKISFEEIERFAKERGWMK